MPSKTPNRKTFTREEALAWSREGEPAPSILAWGISPIDEGRVPAFRLEAHRALTGAKVAAVNRTNIEIGWGHRYAGWTCTSSEFDAQHARFVTITLAAQQPRFVTITRDHEPCQLLQEIA